MSGKKELTKAFNKERLKFTVDAICTAGVGASIAFLNHIGADPETIMSMLLLGAASAGATVYQHGNMLDAQGELNAHKPEQDIGNP